MFAKPIVNPPIPYVGQIGSPLSPGRFVRVVGTVTSSGKQFYVNLQCGSSQFDDVGLHILVYLNERKIILKSQQFGTWHDEHFYENSDITRGKQFEILIICELTVYKIGINGQHLCEYPHKVPYNRVSHIRVEGDVSISQISVEAQPPTTPPQFGYYSQNMQSAPPPYQDTTVPPLLNGPQYNMYNNAPQQMLPPTSNIPMQQQYNPLLQQQVVHQAGVINAQPRVYQRQPFFWSNRYGGNRKMAYIGIGIYVAITLIILTVFLIVFFTVFNKVSNEIDDARKRQDDFHNKHFSNSKW